MKKENINWKNPTKNKHYVVINELPPEHQVDFENYLSGSTIPVISKEGENSFNCAYIWDYEKFLLTLKSRDKS
jgi:hypothetical protein